jgi:hypothetical protein
VTGGWTFGGVRASTPLAIIGETRRETMTPNRPPCSHLDAHAMPALTSARAVGRVAFVHVSTGVILVPEHSGHVARVLRTRTHAG